VRLVQIQFFQQLYQQVVEVVELLHLMLELDYQEVLVEVVKNVIQVHLTH
tara:strand:- start:398 stop:547 length:150 start_codon:yes stop_codon:yes gene_type:complete